jgi:hypothetical protein
MESINPTAKFGQASLGAAPEAPKLFLPKLMVPTRAQILSGTPMGFTPSPTKRIHFSDGKTLALNRRQRRRNKLYNKDLKPIGGK